MTHDEINCLLTLVDINKKPQFFIDSDEEKQYPYEPLSIKVTDKYVMLTIKDSDETSGTVNRAVINAAIMIEDLTTYNLPIAPVSSTFTKYDADNQHYHFRVEYKFTKKYEFTNIQWLNELKADYDTYHAAIKHLHTDDFFSNTIVSLCV
jgi:hypothetical protein